MHASVAPLHPSSYLANGEEAPLPGALNSGPANGLPPGMHEMNTHHFCNFSFASGVRCCALSGGNALHCQHLLRRVRLTVLERPLDARLTPDDREGKILEFNPVKTPRSRLPLPLVLYSV